MSFEEFRKQVNEARAASETRREALKTARQKAANVRRRKEQVLREIEAAARENDPRWAELNEAEVELDQSTSRAGSAYAGALREEWAALEAFLPFTNPLENIASLQDDCPILLLPLRLETRFKKVARDGDGETVDQLWVRVFPDEIAINSFESDLSDAEVRNARTYWLARWAAGKDVDGNRGAWRSLAAAHGPGRAYWLTQNYVPTNLAQEPEKEEGELILAIGIEEALGEPQLSALVAYWQEVWRAEKDGARLQQAWDDLVAAVGEAQATTLVETHKPANLADPPPPGLTRDDTTVRVEFVIFPQTDELETKLHGWSQPPTAAILPERFVFLAFQGDELALPPQLGNLVPPQLILGPDPAAAEGEQFRLATAEDAAAEPDLREGDLIFAENMRWMFDFEEAVGRGMGFKINLSPEQAATGFDRVFVLGLKLSADREQGRHLLEELLQQHHYSRKGLAILKQGTPTNNTEDEAAGYSWRHDPDESFDIYFGDATEPDPADWFEKRDGRWLADLLGIDPAVLQPVENYYHTDIAEGRAMQRALWPATMGHFMDSMMNPVFSPEHIEQTRLFFTRYVSGRGSLPAIRVGKQPYGILPATPYTQMEWFSRRSGRFNLATAPFAPAPGFLAALYRILLDMDQTWMILQRLAAHVGKAGDPHQLLLDIVGLHPASVEIYKRYANSFKQIHNTYNALGYAHEALFNFYPGTFVTAEGLLARYGYTIDEEHPEPDIFKKSFFKNAWILNGPRIDTVPNSEVDAIRVYTTDDKNYIGWLIAAAEESHDRLRLQEGFVDERPPAALLYLLLYHALDLSYIDTSLKLHLSAGIFTQNQVQQAYVEPDFIHIEADNETESRWKYLYKSEEAITGDPQLRLGNYIPLHLDTLDEAAAFRDVLAGLRLLEQVPTAALERLLMEHIDTVSYRLDAWFLGYLHLQLAAMRGLLTQEGESEPRRGLYIGAYGWLEDLRPEDKVLTPVELPEELDELFNRDGDLVQDESNAGYILAPSLNHAVSAAVLRNGHLSNEDPEDKEELKIKLTSERVRQALQIIEGIQGGQTLAALLGYRFERGLHDRTDAEVDAFIFELREKFPLAAKKFRETTPGAEDPEYESIAQIEARNVMHGVDFLEHIEETGTRTYPFDLDLPPASPAQETAINQEVLALIELNDAVADLALAESVHQVVLGNYERASATLDTYSKGNFPPTPEVIRTPRSGVTLTHRVALQLRTGLGNTLGDPGVTPRMVAEPAVHDWLGAHLPALSDVVCVVTYFDRTTATDAEHEISLADIGLAHIDALYLLNIESEQAMSALDDRVVQHILATPAHTLRLDSTIQVDYTRKLDPNKVTVFELTALIASLRVLLLNSKALTPGDVTLPNEASKENEQTLSLDPARVQPIIDALADLRTNALAGYIGDLEALIAADDVDAIVAQLDDLMADLRGIFTQAAAFGMTQSGIGFVYRWQQSMLNRLRTRVAELAQRWDERRAAYLLLRDDYLDGVGALPDEELFDILRRAELQIASVATVWDTPAAYFVHLEGTQFVDFEDVRTNTIAPILDVHTLPALIPAIQAMAPQLAPFDLEGFEIEQELNQVTVFAGDLLSAAENLSNEMQVRETAAAGLLADAAASGDALAQVELVRNAAKAIFGDDFVLVPQFTLAAAQGTEWQNTLADSDHILRYLLNDLDVDFPMDDWLYSTGRVREKLHDLENAILHVEAFTGNSLDLVPSQFPYRADDFWLGLQFPEKKPGTDEPFTIDEDKLLFTGIYSEPFDPVRAQCGLLLDEWTEVIPSRDETAGLAFHYDQPNTEPPQTLLLVTPPRFTGRWQWQDLVSTLHETLDMARKRAVEPDHVDGTVYSRFLPPIVSLASPLPLTATLNLALNNQVFFAKVTDDE